MWTRSARLLIAFYLVFVAGFAVVEIHQLQVYSTAVQDLTAHEIGRHLAAAMTEPGLKRLLVADPDARRQMRSIIGGVTGRSEVVTAIAVVDREGKVVASDDFRVGQQLRPTEQIFSRIASHFYVLSSDPLRGSTYVMEVPLQAGDAVVGYLRIHLNSGRIAQLNRRAMLEFLLASLAGLGLVVIVASWLQNRSSRRVYALAQALDAARRGEVVTAAPARQDDFAPVIEAAERMGQALQEERAHAAEIRERDLAVLSQAMDGGLILLRPDGSTDFVSPRCERFFGCADREELESELTQLGGRLQPALQSVKRGRLAQGSTVDVQLERDGIRRDLRLELYALGAEAREGFLVRVRDLEAVRMVETNLGLAKHLRHLSRVYVATTHEIRAPLHAMALNLELLGIAAAEGDDPTLRARQQNYVKIIGDEFKRLSRLLESLLSQARLHGDAVEPFDLTRAVQEMMTLLEPFCREQHVRVFLAVPEAPVMVLANSDATKQSVLNIVMNALDAMGKGGELRVTLRRDSAGAHLAIADTGPGIAPEIMDHLFQMHATTKQRGTGVGLYVARNVVESFGGSIAVESKPNEGACFEIQLPLAPGEA